MADISKETAKKLFGTGSKEEFFKLAEQLGVKIPGDRDAFYNEIMELKNKQPLSEDDIEKITGGISFPKPGDDIRFY